MCKLCKECGYKLILKFNSTLYYPCPRCKQIKKIINKQNKPFKASKNFNLYNSTPWKWLSHYVLLFYADSQNMVKCSTSPHLEYKVNDKNIHVGHYIKYKDGNSTNNSTALDFYNLAPQNARDNTKLGGMPEVMREFLVSVHGEEKIKEIEARKKIPLKLDVVYLQEISDRYKHLFNELLKERGIENPWK